jgi:predicted PolB exonuclease-like 3'-5' exonuclease
MEAVINGETVDAVAPIERLRETHFDTLESSWNNIKQMYNQHTADDVADAADELVTAAKTPEDMAEIAQNLRNQTGDDPLINTLLDDAVDTSNNLQAQREALRAAYVCLVS